MAAKIRKIRQPDRPVSVGVQGPRIRKTFQQEVAYFTQLRTDEENRRRWEAWAPAFEWQEKFTDDR